MLDDPAHGRLVVDDEHAGLAQVVATLAKPFPPTELARLALEAARGWRFWEVS